MPNLVGIGNSQVPTNGMLGDLAYQDSVDVEIISKIKNESEGTAQDIFVYDTRKDSDGGAWRKRTSHTSWYNEQLGNPERGARAEFPAVAICVIEDKQLVIYDGDDPDMPMWMKFFTRANQRYLIGGNHDQEMRAVTAINGTIIVGNTVGNYNHGGIVEINFITDDALLTSHTTQQYWSGGIARRNREGASKFWRTMTSRNFLHTNNGITRHSLAVTVRPNAPIDPLSGMPKYILAVANSTAISVKLENGYIVDITESGTGAFQSVDFTESGGILYSATGYMTSVIQVPSADDNQATMNTNDRIRLYQYNAYEDAIHVSKGWQSPLMKQVVAMKDRVVAMSRKDSNGFTLLQEAPTRDSSQYGMVCYITSKFNSGWLPGSCKLATMNITDQWTNDSNYGTSEYIYHGGGNKVSNGSDWSGAQSTQSSTPPTGWTGGNGATFKTETGHGAIGNFIRLYNENNGGAGPNSYMYQAITTVVGTKYKISLKQIHRATIQVYVRVGNSINVSNFSNASTSFTSSSSDTPKRIFGTFTATATTTYITLGIISGSHNYSVGWDDVVVSTTSDDRTTFENGLHIIGDVRSSAIYYGSQLMNYHNFSDANYLYQPYNSRLDFGTGDFYVMYWYRFYGSNAYDLHMARRYFDGSSASGSGWYIESGGNNALNVKDSATGATRAATGNTGHIQGEWMHVCFVRKNNIGYAYVNGIQEEYQYTWTENLDNSQATFTVGRNTLGLSGNADGSQITLLKIGKFAPNSEQIRKIYLDEKEWFSMNGLNGQNMTLHGTSDNVIAMDYDDTTDTLHVGTSSGRSDFCNLTRINNTTTAITTVISASNGLIVEQ